MIMWGYCGENSTISSIVFCFVPQHFFSPFGLFQLQKAILPQRDWEEELTQTKINSGGFLLTSRCRLENTERAGAAQTRTPLLRVFVCVWPTRQNKASVRQPLQKEAFQKALKGTSIESTMFFLCNFTEQEFCVISFSFLPVRRLHQCIKLIWLNAASQEMSNYRRESSTAPPAVTLVSPWQRVFGSFLCGTCGRHGRTPENDPPTAAPSPAPCSDTHMNTHTWTRKCAALLRMLRFVKCHWFKFKHFMSVRQFWQHLLLSASQS